MDQPWQPSAPVPVVPPPVEVYRGTGGPPVAGGRSGGVSGGGEVYVNTTSTTFLVDPYRSPRVKLWPCCGCMSLQTACVVIGALGCVEHFIFFMVGVIFLAQNDYPGRNNDVLSQIGVFLLVVAVLGAILDVILIIGARRRNRCLCLIWVLSQLIGMLTFIIIALMGSPLHLVGSLLTIYFLVVVICYIKELDRADWEQQGRTMIMMGDLPPTMTQQNNPYRNVEATSGTGTQFGARRFGEDFGSSYGPPPPPYQAWRLENPVVASLNAEPQEPWTESLA